MKFLNKNFMLLSEDLYFIRKSLIPLQLTYEELWAIYFESKGDEIVLDSESEFSLNMSN